MNERDQCLGCQVASGNIVPVGGLIYENEFWTVSHQLPPSPIVGWLILQPRRHVEALHKLSLMEQQEMARLLPLVDQILRSTRAAEKVYVCLFAESPYCPHLHFHIIPRTADIETRGPEIFGYIPEKYPSEEEIVRFVHSARNQFEQQAQADSEDRT